MAKCHHPVSRACNVTDNSVFDLKKEVAQKIEKNSEEIYQQKEKKKNRQIPSDVLSLETGDYMGEVHAESNYIKTDRKSLSKYILKMDFALKLGYTESLAQIALSRLGVNSTQNELLAELIKLENMPSANYDNVNGLDISFDSLCDQTAKSKSFSSSSDNTFLRPIVIDGSNVAISHGNKEVFSCRGIKLCVDWFKKRGHTDITVFVPKWRKESNRYENPIKEQEILNELERDRMLVFTPSRLIGGKRMVCYDDRYILKLASENEGIIVSNDSYRDLIKENTEFRKVVEERILMYSFVNDRFMPPDDPLGRLGPTLDTFLRILPRKSSISSCCPYGKKCTYGNRCKFNHPEKSIGINKSLAKHSSECSSLSKFTNDLESQGSKSKKLARKSLSYPLNTIEAVSHDVFVGNQNTKFTKKRLCRTRSNKEEYFAHESDQSTKPNQKNLPWCSSFGNTAKLDKSHSVGDVFKETQFRGNNQYENYIHPSSIEFNALTLNESHETQQKTKNFPNIYTKLHHQECEIDHLKLNGVQRTHRPLAPSYSEPRDRYAMLRNSHQKVVRTASVPVSSTKNGICLPTAPKIHLNSNQKRFTTQEIEEIRCKLYYHLSNVFPQNQVLEIMERHPNEISPHKICADILSLYSDT